MHLTPFLIQKQIKADSKKLPGTVVTYPLPLRHNARLISCYNCLTM